MQRGCNAGAWDTEKTVFFRTERNPERGRQEEDARTAASGGRQAAPPRMSGGTTPP